jgi:UDP-N-acetyl-D-glucosamine dehydrogenase
MKKIVAVIGLGYVGLPLAIYAAKSGYSVIGIDSDIDKVAKLNAGISPVEDVNNIAILDVIRMGMFKAHNNYAAIKDAAVILICVPTPLKSSREPDLSFLENAAKLIGKNLSKEVLIILESTVAPGTTRNFLTPIIKSSSGLANEDFNVAFSPERIDPQNKEWNLKNTPKIVAGMTQQARTLSIDFYSKFVDKIIECESLEVAETAKLLENSFRLINISFINELSIFCQKLGIDVNEVITAAATKPYGYMPFYPSIGVGGHCIPIDPLYLANKADEIGSPTKMIDLADHINQEMPGYFVGRAEEKIGGLKGKKVLVIGVCYKPNVADVRETPVKALILGLKNKCAEVFWHDNLVKEWNGEKSVDLSNEYDLAILATPHDYLDLTKLGDVPVLNTRGSI